MRIFCPAIVLSSSLLLVPPSQTWPGGPHPLLCRSNLIRTFAHPRGRACRLGFGATRSLLADVGVAPDDPRTAGRRVEGSPGSVRTQTGPPYAGEPVQWSSDRAAHPGDPAGATGLSCQRSGGLIKSWAVALASRRLAPVIVRVGRPGRGPAVPRRSPAVRSESVAAHPIAEPHRRTCWTAQARPRGPLATLRRRPSTP